MELKVTIATPDHYQYFDRDTIESHCGYIVSDKTSIQGLFSFKVCENYATVSFKYTFNMQAIIKAMDAFLDDHQDITYIEYIGKQNLKKANFVNNRYERK